ncbi:unnamed protein product, partial [Trichogramma brassicae]
LGVGAPSKAGTINSPFCIYPTPLRQHASFGMLTSTSRSACRAPPGKYDRN